MGIDFFGLTFNLSLSGLILSLDAFSDFQY